MSSRAHIRGALRTPFVRQSLTYLAGNIANAIVPFLFLPVLTHYLTPEDYGLVGTAAVIIQVLVVAIGFSGPGLIVGSEFERDQEGQCRLISTNLALALGISLALLVLILASARVLEGVTNFPARWMPLLVLLAFANVLQTTFLALLQARKRPMAYIALQTLATVLGLGLSVALVMEGTGWRGRLMAMTAAAVVAALIACVSLTRMNVLRKVWDARDCRLIMAFGLPLIPHFIGGWAMSLAPRLYLSHMASMADTGLFSLAFSVASPVAMMVGAANQAYQPALFGVLSGGSGLDKVVLGKRLLLAAIAVLALGCLYGAVGAAFLPLLVGARFDGAAPFVFWLSLAFAIQGVYYVFGNFVVYSKKTQLMAWRADSLGGATMVVVTPLLIAWSGPVGAAQAACLGGAVSCAGCIVASRRAYPMPWRHAALAAVRVFV